MTDQLRALVACEYSGTLTSRLLAAGWSAMSCDLLPTEADVPHYQGPVQDVLGYGWDLLVAHPPCTYLTNAGVRWLHEPHGPDDAAPRGRARWQAMVAGAALFRTLLDAPVPHVAVENPIMHRYAVQVVGRRQDQVVQPWHHGHTESKGLALWLRGLPPLRPTDNVKDAMDQLPRSVTRRVHLMAPGPDRARERSRSYPGVADAMVDQWTTHVQATR